MTPNTPCPACRGNCRRVVLLPDDGLNPMERMSAWVGFYQSKCKACGGEGTQHPEPVAHDFPLFDMPAPAGMRTPELEHGLPAGALAVSGEIDA